MRHHTHFRTHHQSTQKPQKKHIFLKRGVALLIDGVLASFATQLLYMIFLPSVVGPFDFHFGLNLLPDTVNGLRGLIISLLPYFFFAYMLAQYGWTPGKRVFKLSVIDTHTRYNLTFTHALIRETFKVISGLVFFLGFLWVLWDPDKQTWHDKLANSAVLSV